MATTLKYGSRGGEVSSLQDMLNQMGYGLATDGIYGEATHKAVSDYQARNGLAADGIVGANTWGALSGGKSAQQAQQTAAGGSVPGFTQQQPTYNDSQALLDAADKLNQHEGKKPGDYQSAYGDQIQGLLDQMLNRPDFKYDVATDPLYQQYAEQYQRQGQKAMQDTMGQAAALTGGYGNSYAQTAGQQTYQGYLEGMNSRVPELYAAAYDRYRGQGEDMRGNLGMLMGMEDSQYGRYRDTVGDYNIDRDYLTGRYDSQYEKDYGKYLNDAALWQNARDFAYQQEKDRLAQGNWEKEYNLAVSQATRKGSGGGGGGKPNPNTAHVPTSYKEFNALMKNSVEIYDENTFMRHKNGNSSAVAGFKTYQDYLNAKWAQYN